MRKFLIGAPLALAAAAVLSTPAAAQMRGSDHGRDYSRNDGRELRGEIAQLDRQVDQAQNRRLISNREAQRLDREVNQLERLHAQFARGGFTRTELRTLNQRIDSVQRMVSREINDRDGRRG
jgi:hypothetical protein